MDECFVLVFADLVAVTGVLSAPHPPKGRAIFSFNVANVLSQKISSIISKSLQCLHVSSIKMILINEHTLGVLKPKYNRQKYSKPWVKTNYFFLN